MIASGSVRVNGRPAQIGDKIDPDRDTVTVFGKRVRRTERNVYLLLHKPRGYVTTLSDNLGRRCVTDLLRDVPERVYTDGKVRGDGKVRHYP